METELSPGTIILMRHGRPRIATDVRLSPREFGHWVRHYDEAGLDPALPPPPAAQAAARQCTLTVCSHLPRSRESARALGIAEPDLTTSQFREMDLPHGSWSWPRLGPAAWAVLFRLLWAGGLPGQGETWREAMTRAQACARHLARLAQRQGPVLFVGHGTLNWFIARHLGQLGWTSQDKPPRAHWACAVYHAPR